MDEIRILVRILATGKEADFALVLVDALQAAHHVIALGDLALDLSLRGVNEIEMPPTVALGGVEDFIRLSQISNDGEPGILHALAVGGPYEGFTLFVDEIADLAGLGI